MSTSRFALFAAALAVLAVPAAQGQLVFDDFDDGDFANVFQFSELGGAGVGIDLTTGPDGSNALRADIDPAAAGSFAGFGFTQNGGGTFDASGQAYFSFFIRPNVVAANTPLVLELNLQEDPGGDGFDPLVDDEFEARYVVDPGVANCWKLVQIPVASFADDNSVNVGSDDGFDFSSVLNFIVAIGGPAGPAYSVDFDELTFSNDVPTLVQEVVLNDFEADPTASVFTFSETNAGIGVGSAAPAPEATGSTQALSIGIDPAQTGAFAGYVIRRPAGGSVTTSNSDYLGFYLRPLVDASNTPLLLEINLHEDVNNDGMYDGATEDEVQATYLVDPDDSGTWRFVAIPLALFADDNSVFAGSDDGFDFNKLFEVVVAIGGPVGTEFAIETDDVFFGGVEEVVPNFNVTASSGSANVIAGGSFTVNFTVENNTANPVTGDLFFTAAPGGFQGPVFNNVTLAAGGSVSNSYSQFVPSFAPAGSYVYTVRIGQFPNVTVDAEALTINVLSPPQRVPGAALSWRVADAVWEDAAAARTADAGAYPNPFARETTIRFETAESSEVRLAVYDVTGREVAVLVQGVLGAGTHEAAFDARDLASGLYVWHLEAGSRTETGRLTRIR
ncbi:MAG: T9SS type A sorting domain-containing protein [Bacteroidota bacterium]